MQLAFAAFSTVPDKSCFPDGHEGQRRGGEAPRFLQLHCACIAMMEENEQAAQKQSMVNRDPQG